MTVAFQSLNRLLACAAGVLVILVAVIVVPAGPVQACSCDVSGPRTMLADSDVGFIGSLESTRRSGSGPSTYRFRVDRVLAGELDASTVDVDAVDLEMCGGPALPGPLAVMAWRNGERLMTGGCSTMDVEVMLAAVDGDPGRGGTAVVAVPGIFDDGRYALLDPDGMLVGFEGDPEPGLRRDVFVCSGGSHAVTLGSPDIDIVDLASMEVNSVDTGDLQQSAIIEDISCNDAAQGDVRLLVSSSTGAGEVRSLDELDRPGRSVEIEALSDSVFVGGDVVSVERLEPSGSRLIAIDETGTRTQIGQLDLSSEIGTSGYAGLVADPAGERLAVGEVNYLNAGGAFSRIAVLDPSEGTEIIAIDVKGSITVEQWLTDGRLMTTRSSNARTDLQLRDPDTLDVIVELRGWRGFATVVGDHVWGTNQGTVIRGSLSSGHIEELTVLPSPAIGPILALTRPITIAPQIADAPAVVLKPNRAPITVLADTNAESGERENQATTSPIQSHRRERSTQWWWIAGGLAVAAAAIATIAAKKRRPTSAPPD